MAENQAAMPGLNRTGQSCDVEIGGKASRLIGDDLTCSVQHLGIMLTRYIGRPKVEIN